MKRKTLRRTKQQAETLARSLKKSGHSDVVISRITATDWSIVWTERRDSDCGCGESKPALALRCWKCDREIVLRETGSPSKVAAQRVEPAQTYTETEVRCAVCNVKLQEAELAAIRRDTDFVPHGDRGHLIRVES